MSGEGLAELRDVLAAFGVPDLKARARLVASSIPTRKAELIDLLCENLLNPRFLRAYYEQLGDLERSALREAVHDDGEVDTLVLKAKYGRAPTLSRYHGGYGRDQATAPLEIFFLADQVIPEPVTQLLREFVPPPEEFHLTGERDAPEEFTNRDGDHIPLQRAGTERAAIHDFLATLELARAGKIAVSEKTKLPAAAALRALEPRLLLPRYLESEKATADDSIRAFGLVVAAQAGGLARAVGTKLQLTRAGEAFLRDPSVARLREAWDRYLNADSPDEIRRIRNLKGQQAKRTRFTPSSERKEAIAAGLGRCPVGEWIPSLRFLQALTAWGLLFEVERTDDTNLCVGYATEYDTFGEGGYYHLVQGQYLLAVLWEYAAGFGAVDILYTSPEDADYPIEAPYFDEDYFSRYDGLNHFRINALGAYLLGLAATYEGPAVAEEAPAFTVLPNLEIAVTDPARLAPNDRALLERFTTARSEGVYRLDRERILGAVEEGVSVDVLSGFLERRGTHDLPQPVARFLEDLRANVQALGAPARALLVPCHDLHARDLILHDTTLGRLCQAAGESDLVVREEDETAFRRALKRQGYVLRGSGA